MASISGVAFNDYDADGIREAREPLLANRVVYIDANADSVLSAPAALQTRMAVDIPKPIPDPFAFVDWCDAATQNSEVSEVALIRRIQFVEMHLLLRASFEDTAREFGQ